MSKLLQVADGVHLPSLSKLLAFAPFERRGGRQESGLRSETKEVRGSLAKLRVRSSRPPRARDRSQRLTIARQARPGKDQCSSISAGAIVAPPGLKCAVRWPRCGSRAVSQHVCGCHVRVCRLASVGCHPRRPKGTSESHAPVDGDASARMPRQPSQIRSMRVSAPLGPCGLEA